jgi:quercetin dioxygenase-like cupin family protein
MTASPFVVTPKDYDRPLNLVGEELIILASGARTGGYEVFLQRGPEGAGPPPHNHPWDESFYVVKGEIEFGIDEKHMTATAGTLVHLPAGTTHWFRFGKGGGEMVSMTSREAASHFFTDMDREVSPTNPQIAKLAEVGGRYGLKLGV